jgi:hypothetical protein
MFTYGKKYTPSHDILKHGDYDIVLLESVNCANVDELRARERHHIETNPQCVNIRVPTRTLDEFKQTDQYKQYCQLYNKDYKNDIRRREHVTKFKISHHGHKILCASKT